MRLPFRPHVVAEGVECSIFIASIVFQYIVEKWLKGSFAALWAL